jgi:hypothetical protein
MPAGTCRVPSRQGPAGLTRGPHKDNAKISLLIRDRAAAAEERDTDRKYRGGKQLWKARSPASRISKWVARELSLYSRRRGSWLVIARSEGPPSERTNRRRPAKRVPRPPLARKRGWSLGVLGSQAGAWEPGPYIATPRRLAAGAQLCASPRIYTIRRWRPPAGAIGFLSASSIQV